MAVMTKTSLESGSHNTDNYMKIFMCAYTHMHTKASTSALGKKTTNPNKKPKNNNDKKTPQTNKQQKRKPTTKALKCILKRLIGKDTQEFCQNIWLLLLQGKWLNESLWSNFFLEASLELGRSEISCLNCFWNLDPGFLWLVLTSE